MKKTKIVCTIGPSSDNREMLAALLKSGMNVMRLNFSHGDYEEHGRRISMMRDLMAEQGEIYAIMLDTKGPEIRTGRLNGVKEVTLNAGSQVILSTKSDVPGDASRLSVSYHRLHEDLKVGDTVLLDDGLIGLKVQGIEGTEITCDILNSGVLGEHKGVNLPKTHINMPFLSERDKQDLLFGIKQDVLMVMRTPRLLFLA